MPVFSNVKEPERLPPLAKRQRSAVVFGKAESRRAIYTEHFEQLAYICRHLSLTGIIDVGPGPEMKFETVIKSIRTGAISADEVSSILQNSVIGILNDPSAVLGKSGIFAAYAAHEVAPINLTCGRDCNEDGLIEREHFLSVDRMNDVTEEQLQLVGKNVGSWYAGHNLRSQAASFASLFHALSPEIAQSIR